MAQVGLALLAAYESGASVETLSEKLRLPVDWVEERIEAARLSLCVAGICSLD